MLIEARISPNDKRSLNHVVREISKQYHLTPNQFHKVPHISLYGSFNCKPNDIRRVIDVLSSNCRNFDPIELHIEGFESIKNPPNNNVIFFKPVHSARLEEMRLLLRNELNLFAPSVKQWDYKRLLESVFGSGFIYHIAVAYKLPDKKFENIWSWLQNKEFNKKLNIQRITFLSNQAKIISEYDLKYKRMLTRQEALHYRNW